MNQMNLIFAYFDPNTGSLLLQAMVGGFGGVMVVGRYLWLQMRESRQLSNEMVEVPSVTIPTQNHSN